MVSNVAELILRVLRPGQYAGGSGAAAADLEAVPPEAGGERSRSAYPPE